MACPGCGDKPVVKPVTSPIYTQEYSKDGANYDMGCFYEFKDSKDECWELGVLCDIDDGKYKSKCGNKSEWFDLIKECNGVFGKIITPPIELIDGERYEFDYPERDKLVLGYYIKLLEVKA